MLVHVHLLAIRSYKHVNGWNEMNETLHVLSMACFKRGRLKKNTVNLSLNFLNPF